MTTNRTSIGVNTFKMREKVILVPPCFSFGDCFAMVGMVYYLLNHYEKVFFVNAGHSHISEYFYNYFSAEELLNERIFITTNAEDLLDKAYYGEYDICNTHTGEWSEPNTIYKSHPNIDEKYYFNNINPVYNQLDVPEEYRSEIVSLPNRVVNVNHIFYYKLVGLNNKVRMDFFDYKRNTKEEAENKARVLKDLGITGKYCIVNNPLQPGLIEDNLKYPHINISGLAKTTGYLLSLIEDAEEIHLIESLNTNFLYHCQYKKILNYDKKVYFHVWCRNRNWPQPNVNLDYSWKMFNNPRLDNWNFLFNKENYVN